MSFRVAGAEPSQWAVLDIDRTNWLFGSETTWTRAKRGSSDAYAVLRADGNFVLYGRPGHAIWSTHTAGTGADNRLVMRDDGNLVMYTAKNRVVWQSGSSRGTLVSGESLQPGQVLKNVYVEGLAPTVLTMQKDGNLVLRYQGVVLWASNTLAAGSSLLMRPTGNLVIRRGGRVFWESQTARLTARSDGAPFLHVDPAGSFSVQFTPRDDGTGPRGNYVVYMSWKRPGEAYRRYSGRMRYLTRHSVMRRGQALSSTKGHRLVLRHSGNLVLVSPAGRVLWQTRTAGHPGARLVLNKRGQLVLQGVHRRIWAARARGRMVNGAINLAVYKNGRVAIVGSKGKVIWRSPR